MTERTPGLLDDAAAFLALTDKIARDRGFDAPRYKDTCLRRRIAVRMRARGMPDYTAYGRLLDSDPEEYDRLLDVLTINVTRLFRNLETWDAVAHTVLPALWALPAPRLACWVAGCASGEEAYTLAVLWHQFIAARPHAEVAGGAGAAEAEALANNRVRITASDIDAASLETARRGTYASTAFVDVPPALRARYFTRTAHADREEVSPLLRRSVYFERRDILQDPPPGPLHFISCRNVIIYFDRASQEALMRRFHAALLPGGFLVLGKVETLLGPSRELFEVVDQRQRIFRRP